MGDPCVDSRPVSVTVLSAHPRESLSGRYLDVRLNLSPRSNIDPDISLVETDLFGPHRDLLRRPPGPGEHNHGRRQSSMARPIQLFWSHDRDVDCLVRTRSCLEIPRAYSPRFPRDQVMTLVPQGKSTRDEAGGSMDQNGRALCLLIRSRSCLEGEFTLVI